MPRPVMTSPHRNNLTDRRSGVSVGCAATLIAKSAWPKIMQRLRRSGLGVLKFRGRQAGSERCEYRTRGFFRVDSWVAVDAIMNAFKEGASTLRRQMSAWMPSFIVEPTQQWRQLRSNVYGLILRKAVTQRMKRCQQNQIDPLAVMTAETAHDVIDPDLYLRYGGAEILKGRHDHLPDYSTFSAKEDVGICARSSGAAWFIDFLTGAFQEARNG